MSVKSARFGVWNRRLLALFWGLFGLVCLGLLFHTFWWQTKLFFGPAAAGIAFLASSIAFYRGSAWGRSAIGVLVSVLALYCFDRLLYLHFQRHHGFFFFLVCLVLAAAFYTFLFLFSGLDRDSRLLDDGDENESGESDPGDTP